MDARPVLALFVQLSAAMNPRIGGRRGDFPPAPSFPHFFGKKWGPRPGRPAPPGGTPARERGTPHPPQCAHWGTFPPQGGRLRVESIRPRGIPRQTAGRPGVRPLRQAGEPSCRGRRPERSRTARRGRRAPRAGGSGGGGMISTPTGRGSYPPAGQAPPYASSSRSTCPAERAKSRAAARASWRVLPWVPTSTSTEPVDSCWLYREERMVMGRARVG